MNPSCLHLYRESIRFKHKSIISMQNLFNMTLPSHKCCTTKITVQYTFLNARQHNNTSMLYHVVKSFWRFQTSPLPISANTKTIWFCSQATDKYLRDHLITKETTLETTLGGWQKSFKTLVVLYILQAIWLDCNWETESMSMCNQIQKTGLQVKLGRQSTK